MSDVRAERNLALDVSARLQARDLVGREDMWLTQEALEHNLRSGAWTERSFVDALLRHAAERPEALAVVDEDGTRTTFGDLERLTRAFALGLLAHGLRPGDRVALQVPNGSAFCVGLLGCARAGLLPVLLHMPYTEHDIAYIAELTSPTALVVPREHRGRDHLTTALEVQARFTGIRHVISIGGGDGALDWDALLTAGEDADPAALDALRPGGLDAFFVMFTSGTTGRPKAELHLHANNARWIECFSQVHDFADDAHWLLVTPLAHLTALGIGVLSGLERGAPLSVLQGWDVDRCIEVLERDRPSYLLGAPPMLIDLARHPDLERARGTLKTICYAGAPCPADILSTLADRLGCEIVAFYGYSEAGVTHMTGPDDPIAVTSRSIGRLVPGLEQRFVDPAGDDVLPPCEGEILTRGASFIPGYYRQPEATRKMFTSDGWFRSADVLRVDGDGCCTFVSRRDDLINRGGYKIDPRELEEVLYTHPRIAQAAVVAIPDERLGQRAGLFVVPTTAGDELTLADVTEFLGARGVSRSLWPEALRSVDAFPMTSTGKFMRYALREQARELQLER